ncbi:MAG: ABC transporter ATP-binding protein [Deltaproteobacteria bacterium]|nr:ABC transporter ATP-binding protein [Candidatus Anaeroferrophillacea bacterium]
MIALDNVGIRLPGFAVDDVSLTVGEGDFYVLMGPTGAGKTLILEAVAGLVPLAAGRIRIAGRDVSALPPEQRRIGIVYQDYALFPHLTVAANIRYGLPYHPDAADGRQIDGLVDLLRVGDLLHRRPATLSGGEQQRVALARALAVCPRVLLLDEPLAALDPRFRGELREHLRSLQRTTGVTMLMVTHDFVEALTLADRGAIVNRGRIEQEDTIEALFQRPATPFVADFVGMKNLFPAMFVPAGARLGALTVVLGDGGPATGRGYVAIRPEDIILSPGTLHSSMRNSFAGTVIGSTGQGFHHEVTVRCDATDFCALITRQAFLDLGITPGLPLNVSFKATAMHVIS